MSPSTDSTQPLVLLTGANGFIGSTLLPILLEQGMRLRVLSRRTVDVPPVVDVHVVPDLAGPGLDRAVKDVQVVCHLAGRAHVTGKGRDEQRAFDEVNVEASRRIARAAFRGGSARMVFVSSIGAVGSMSDPGRPLAESEPCHPVTAYGRSKQRAEQALREEAERHDAELVVIRPPLVHGQGAPGNLALLRRLVGRGVPLPLAGVDNRRSLIHVRNLAQVLAAAITVPEAAGRTFHVRDGADYSTPQIVAAAAREAGRPARMFRVPLTMVRAAAVVSGRRSTFEQLTGWLQVDDRQARVILGVTPADLPLEIGTLAR